MLARATPAELAREAEVRAIKGAGGRVRTLGQDRLNEISFLSKVSRDQLPVAVVGLDQRRIGADPLDELLRQ